MRHVLKIKFYGTRGSIPITDPKFHEFGGNTTCISIKNNMDNMLGILDAGTGIRTLGKEITAPDYPIDNNEITILFSHFHWDHILGFPFFDPLYDSKRKIVIIAMGKIKPIKTLKEVFDVALQSEYFPVGLEDMKAKIEFLMPGRDMEIFGNTKVIAYYHNHPGGAYSFRLEWKGKVLVICTDIEHGEMIDQNIVKLAKKADLLIHDAQYTTEELKNKRGWGHSSYEQAINVAEQASCKQLILTHHDPDHNDDYLKNIEKKCQIKFSNCSLAREGLEIEI